MYRSEKREERGLALLFARAAARDPPVSRATEARVLFSHLPTPLRTRLSTRLSTRHSTLSARLSARLSTRLSTCLCTLNSLLDSLLASLLTSLLAFLLASLLDSLFDSLLDSLPTRLFTRLSIQLSIRLSTRLSTRISIRISTRARAGLLANSGCFVSKCILWCFVVFCGVLRVFCGVLQVFCGVLRVFCSISTKHTKHPKNIEKYRKTQKTHNTLVYRGRLQRAKKFGRIAQNTFHKTSSKHRKTPQNTAKQSQNAFCEITSQNTAKQTQNAQKTHKTVALQPQYALRAFGVFFVKNTLDLSQKYTMRNTRKLRIVGGVTYPRRGSQFFKKQCFAVFCGVLRCFAVFCVHVFSVFHKTAQNRPKNTQNAQNEQNTLCAIQRNTVLCVFLSLRKCLQKSFAKHVQNIAKHPQNTAKHCVSKNTRKTPQNTRKTPAKHRKTLQNTTKQIF